MNYWWVNQNQTHRQEVGGGYMWSPKLNSDGGYNHFYNNMTLVRPGDIVYSFFGTKIQYIGTITSCGYSYGKPDEFGSSGDYWNKDGWRVDVDYEKLESVISPRDYISQLRDYLPKKYSPLRSDGQGNQIYLTYIPDNLANKLNELIGSEIQGIEVNSLQFIGDDQTEIDAVEKQQVREIQQSDIEITEKESLVKSRIGQGKFRDDVLELYQKCPFTKITNPKLLRAGHLKPWAECDNRERLDPYNGLALTPTFDLLVDRGYLSFENNGDLILSSTLTQNEISQLELPDDFRLKILNDSQRIYIKYHRTEIFKV